MSANCFGSSLGVKNLAIFINKQRHLEKPFLAMFSIIDIFLVSHHSPQPF